MLILYIKTWWTTFQEKQICNRRISFKQRKGLNLVIAFQLRGLFFLSRAWFPQWYNKAESPSRYGMISTRSRNQELCSINAKGRDIIFLYFPGGVAQKSYEVRQHFGWVLKTDILMSIGLKTLLKNPCFSIKLILKVSRDNP